MSTPATIVYPVKCRLCGKVMEESIPILGEPAQEKARRMVNRMQMHYQSKHPEKWQAVLTAGVICGQMIPAFLMGGDFDLTPELEKARDVERSKMHRLTRKVRIEESELLEKARDLDMNSDDRGPHQDDVYAVLKDLRDRYEEIGEYAVIPEQKQN